MSASDAMDATAALLTVPNPTENIVDIGYGWVGNLLNISSQTKFSGIWSSSRETSELLVGAFTLVLIVLLSLIGNIMVILAIFTHKPLKKVQNFLLVSLAVADLAVAVFVVPFHIVKFLTGRWPFGFILCQMWITSDILICTASILNLCAIALDRYWAIRYPIAYAHKRTLTLVLVIICCVWSVSALISVPPLLGWNDWSQNGLSEFCEYTTEKGFVVYSACGSFFVPLVLMSTVYAKIFVAARERLRHRVLSHNSLRRAAVTKSVEMNTTNVQHSPVGAQKSTDRSPGGPKITADNLSHSHSDCDEPSMHGSDSTMHGGRQYKAITLLPVPAIPDMRLAANVKRQLHRMDTTSYLQTFLRDKERISVSREKKAAKTLAVIMGVFVLCWLPFFIAYVTTPFCDCISEKVFEATNWLGYINSSLNPIIYTIFNLDFRLAFRRILRQCTAKFSQR